MKFKIIGKITDIEKIAEGSGVKMRSYLNREYGKRRWIKYKGFTHIILLHNQKEAIAEVHWFQAHGIGKRMKKIKEILEYL